MRTRAAGRVLLTIEVMALLVAGCASPGMPTIPPSPPPAFDVAAVKASFTDECRDRIVVDDLFCTQVEIEGLFGNGNILKVPTTLATYVPDRSRAICNQIALAHFDAEGSDLGYEVSASWTVLDSGSPLARCRERRMCAARSARWSIAHRGIG